jgi:hypothetical protein
MADQLTEAPVLSVNKVAEITAALQSHVPKPCPMCGSENFTVVHGFIPLGITQSADHPTFFGPQIPCAAAICQRCGFITLHAAGILGLMTKNEEKEEKEGAK